MASPSIIVRPLTTLEEVVQLFLWADQAFSQQPDPVRAQNRGQTAFTKPNVLSRQLRGAFRDNKQLGSYALYSWTLRMGAARIPTACIGMVVVDPEARKQGIASTLMHDAIQLASEQGESLLLLDGIPDFYYRYGYTDVFDVTRYDINRAAILALAGSSHTVRPATPEDAPALRGLYERRLGGYTASFERSQEKQENLLSDRFRANTVLLALSPEQAVEGYLMVSQPPDLTQALELAADNWPAQVALMQAHVQLTNGPEAPATHTYYLPPTSAELYRIIDHLEVPDTSNWENPAEEWGVRASQFHHRHAGWLARFTRLPLLFNAMLPELEARWQRSLAHWSGELQFIIENERVTLAINGATLELVETAGPTALTFQCSPQSFTQLIFGYRPASWLLAQQPQTLPAEALAILTQLFPTEHTWISFTDSF
ncbi:hypothetical protein KDA_45030 [Dictyobacter alpinus]|uniref:N-acetyltransferase domain-containing protein n=1 Tax=Dictyobacter alpinus TaxID=2014873 RepID=A0A402BCE7_9CHLR|nr:GNAT family N-acetyltransferase [Dictyobacter alpinus]GCE29019.1 hypothetical protein KDA_45030 [Dictyobacter alpinus]